MTSIQLKQLTIGYHDTKTPSVVAMDLNAQLRPGEMTCLLGANGKGKSTLMKTMSGFLAPISGEVLLDGCRLSTFSEKELARKVAIVLTEKISIAHVTVFEFVSYGRSPFTGFMGRLVSEDRRVVEQSIQQCGIAHKSNSLLSSLSDGERQKATIAKALAQDTPFILLDEPTAFLDLPARVEIMQLLRTLASQSQKSILMSTHDLDLALQMSDRLWLLHPDHIKFGSPEDLLLQNAFQPMFQQGGIEFDNKTGMFRVQYEYQSIFAVQGHGFEYVLLRRAFSRKGIRLEKRNKESRVWIEVTNNHSSPYQFYVDGVLVNTFESVEVCVQNAILQLNPIEQLREVAIN